MCQHFIFSAIFVRTKNFWLVCFPGFLIICLLPWTTKPSWNGGPPLEAVLFQVPQMLISMENGLIIHIVKMAEMLPLKVYLFTFGCSVHKSSWILDVCELLCWQPFEFCYLKMFIGTNKGCLLLNRRFCSQTEQFLFFMDCSLLRIVTKKRRDAFHECVLLHRVYKLKVQLNLNIQKLTRKPAFEVTNKVSLEMNALFSFSVIFMKAFFLSIKSKLWRFFPSQYCYL